MLLFIVEFKVNPWIKDEKFEKEKIDASKMNHNHVDENGVRGMIGINTIAVIGTLTKTEEEDVFVVLECV